MIKFEAFAGTNATYLMPGDELEITGWYRSIQCSCKT